MLGEARKYTNVVEVMLLSTCNRTELVAVGESESSIESLKSELRKMIVSRVPETDGHLYLYDGTDALQHIFRVVSSLDSLVVGEPQILGQFKDAFELACRQGTVGNHLHKVVARALRTAKRVRHETQVGTGQVSVPTVALDLRNRSLAKCRVTRSSCLALAKMGELVARLLQQSGARLIIVGRNAARVERTANSLSGRGQAVRCT